jgi:hypothetical protein
MVDERIDKLIEDFSTAARKHHEATMQGHWQETNRQARNISRAFHRITEAGDSARQALLAQVHNDDLAVASSAAVFSLKYDTERSLEALQRIAKEPGIIGFGAKQAILRWEEGEWQLE